MNDNSGTYQPGEKELSAAALYMQAVFTHLKVVGDMSARGA
jgi:hypothetical protein